MSGPLRSFVARGDRISARIVTQLVESLGFTLDDDVSVVRSASERAARGDRPRRGRGRNHARGIGSARRALLKDIADKWPELGDQHHWKESSLLKADNQKKLLAEIKALPNWKSYDDRLKQMATSREKGQRHSCAPQSCAA